MGALALVLAPTFAFARDRYHRHGWGPRVAIVPPMPMPIPVPVIVSPHHLVRPRIHVRAPVVVEPRRVWRHRRWYPAPVVVVQTQPQQQVAPAEPVQQQQVWYYCRSQGGYYPTVPECPEQWEPVNADGSPAQTD